MSLSTGVTSLRTFVPAIFLRKTPGEVSQGSGHPHTDSQNGDQSRLMEAAVGRSLEF